MKKILIAREIQKMLGQKPSLLDRTDVKVFTAASSEEALRIHRDEGCILSLRSSICPA